MSTQTATAAKITYRKTGTGEWVAFGPASAISAGTVVMVTKASGETRNERIASVGRPFTANGQTMVYGYLDKNTSISQAGTTWMTSGPRKQASRPMCDNCGERRAVTAARDLSGFTGEVCGQCKREEGSLSFA